jgi:hypothetical protein
VMKALNVEIHEEEAERQSPILVPHGSLERASALLRVDVTDAAIPA